MATTHTPATDNWLIFRIGRVACAVPALAVDTILLPPEHLTAAPGADAGSPGMFRHGHETVAAVDLRHRFGLDPVDLRRGRLLLGHVSGHPYAFWVEEIVGLAGAAEVSPATLPPELPHNVFTAALLYRKEIVLCSDLTRLLLMRDAGILRQMVRPTEPAAPPTPETVAREKPAAAAIPAAPRAELAPEVKTAAPTAHRPVASGDEPAEQTPAVPPIAARDRAATVAPRPEPSLPPRIRSPASTATVPPPSTPATPEATRRPPVTPASTLQTRPVAPTPPPRNPAPVARPPFSPPPAPVIDEPTAAAGSPTGSNPAGPLPLLLLLALLAALGIGGWFALDLWLAPAPLRPAAPPSAAAPAVTPPRPPVVAKPAPAAPAKVIAAAPGIEVQQDGRDITIVIDRNHAKPGIASAPESAAPPASDQVSAPPEPAQPESPPPAVSNEETQGPAAETASAPPPAAPPPPTVYVHVVVKGDTLWAIAERYLNDPWRYHELAKSSRIRNPDLIYPGQKVRIVIR